MSDSSNTVGVRMSSSYMFRCLNYIVKTFQEAVAHPLVIPIQYLVNTSRRRPRKRLHLKSLSSSTQSNHILKCSVADEISG